MLERDVSDNDRLERYGRWLMSIPRDDVSALQGSPEYVAFLQAFERLGDAHRILVIRNQTSMQCNGIENNNEEGHSSSNDIRHGSSMRQGYSFLQHLAVDDVILRVFEFLGCEALVRTSMTCHRFHNLSLRSAEQRTHDMTSSRILGCAMKMLRAKEEIEGVVTNNRPFVRIPILGLGRRIEVLRAGDNEYNGIYFCTGSNGNGFIFSKPRAPERRVNTDFLSHNIDSDELEGSMPSVRLLRCIISKKFSEDVREFIISILFFAAKITLLTLFPSLPYFFQMEDQQTILWYMSREIIVPNSTGGAAEIDQEYSFWAPLLISGNASPDICLYPSPTSILINSNQPGWQTLDDVSLNPPIVELLD